MTHIPILALVELFAALLLAGTLLLLPLFKFKWRRLARSSLFIKVVMWIPIFVGLIACLYMSNGWRWGLALLLDGLAYLELRRQLQRRPEQQILLLGFYAVFAFCSFRIAMAGMFFEPQQAVDFLVTVCFASALSDATAFFLGNYFGKHKLPAILNNKKSWEGVAGQLIGALAGVALLKAFGIGSIFWLWLPAGLGSALGDLANSYVKRRLKIKDWGNSIPGHGGYLDRFASLFGALALAYYALLFWG